MAYVDITSPKTAFLEHSYVPDIFWTTDMPYYAYELQYKLKESDTWSTTGKQIIPEDQSVDKCSANVIYDNLQVDFLEIYYRIVLYYDFDNEVNGNQGHLKGHITSATYCLIFSENIVAKMKFYDGKEQYEFPLFDEINEETVERAELELLKINATQPEDTETKTLIMPLVDGKSALKNRAKINTEKGIKFMVMNDPVMYNPQIYMYGYMDQIVYQTLEGYGYFYKPVYGYSPDYSYNTFYDSYRLYSMQTVYDTEYRYYQYYQYNTYYYYYDYTYTDYATGSSTSYWTDYYTVAYTASGSYSYTDYYTYYYTAYGSRSFGYTQPIQAVGYRLAYNMYYYPRATGYRYAVSYTYTYYKDMVGYQTYSYTASATGSRPATGSYTYTGYYTGSTQRSSTSYYTYISGYGTATARGSGSYQVYSYEGTKDLYDTYVYYPVNYYYYYANGAYQIYVSYYNSYISGYHPELLGYYNYSSITYYYTGSFEYSYYINN